MKFFQSNNITLICLCDKFQLWKALKMVGLQGSIPYMGIVWSLCQSEESMTLLQIIPVIWIFYLPLKAYLYSSITKCWGAEG